MINNSIRRRRYYWTAMESRHDAGIRNHISHQRPQRGFSLVEVLVVITVVAILTAVAIPSYRTYMAQRRLNGATRELQTNLMAMRMQAVTENRWIAMNIDSNHQYTIFRDVNKNGVLDSVEAIAAKDFHPSYYDVTFTTGIGMVLIFYPDGTANSGTVCISGAPGLNTKKVNVNSSGRVKLEETITCP